MSVHMQPTVHHQQVRADTRAGYRWRHAWLDDRAHYLACNKL